MGWSGEQLITIKGVARATVYEHACFDRKFCAFREIVRIRTGRRREGLPYKEEWRLEKVDFLHAMC